MSDLSPSRKHILISAILFEGGLGLLAWMLGTLIPRPPLEQIRFAARDAGLALVASLPLMAGLIVVSRYPVGLLRELKLLVREQLVPLFQNCTLVDLAVVSMLAGIGEELFFRGLVQEAITQRFGPFLGIASASVLFGLAHPITRTYAVLAGLIGLYLGLLMLWSDNLLVPIMVHACYDFFALVYLLRIARAE